MKRFYLLAFQILFISGFCSSQNNLERLSHKVYITGNTIGISENNLNRLKSVIQDENADATLIYSGDILHNNGLINSSTPQDSAFIKSLLDVATGKNNVIVYFTPGDLDWNDSGKDGWDAVNNLEKLINGIAGRNAFLPGSACPGPEVISSGNHLDIVCINTQWLIHPFHRPYSPDTDCKVLVEDQFSEELEEILEETKDKNILIVGHHPALSFGEYGGYTPVKKHLSPPVIGSFKAGYHQNIGSPKDMSFPAYNEFADHMRRNIRDYAPVIYASSHDYNTQLIGYENSYQLVSGAIAKNIPAGNSENTLYKSDQDGFISISYYDNGRVELDIYEFQNDESINKTSKQLFKSFCTDTKSEVPFNTRVVPCKELIVAASGMNRSFYDSSAIAIGGKQYKAGFFKKLMLGTLYRSSWTTPIKVSFLNLDTIKGGLTATGAGGGRQTHSLSLEGNDGRSYVFRSVDKDPIKALNPVLRKTFVAGLTRQFTATQNPYGALAVKYLLDSTNILHARPQLFILPDDPKLGSLQKEFGGMLGMLEEKPKKSKSGQPGTFNADDVVRSFDLFRKLYKDHYNRVNQQAFLEARIFDIWIGDWGRHEDNWKWAGFKKENQNQFYPIPRDRDHAFSLWNGLLPYLVSRKWALPNLENFGEHFKDIKSLTYPARHLDRIVLTGIEKNDFLKASLALQDKMNDALIDSAIKNLPHEIIPASGNTIAAKLKSRRGELQNAVSKYYDLLAKNVNVIGSNKKEIFLIERLPDQTVRVIIKVKKDKSEGDTILYQRLFKADETQNIHVYGLDGDDEFLITGSSKKSIRVRVFGGKGDDIFINESSVKGRKKLTRIYDYKTNEKNSFKEGLNSKVILSDDRSLVEYNRKPVHYDTFLPLPFLYYSAEDGFEAGLGLSYVFHRFGEDGYANKLRISDRFSSTGNVQVKIMDEFHHLFGNWDLLLGVELAQPYGPAYFYGAGNETVKLTEVSDDYYKSRIYGFNSFAGLQKVFWRKSSFNIGINYENNATTIFSENFLSQSINVFGKNKLDFVGVSSSLDIDFRNSSIFPKHGVRFVASQELSHFNISDDKNFGNTEISIEFYQTSRTRLPLTLGIKSGYTHAIGDIPFYKYNTLGRTTGLRGYDRDRFAGNSSLRLNTQLSVEFGTLNTSVLPLTIGILVFYDAGRVWIPGETSDKIHMGYGTGFYFTPLAEVLTTRFSVAFSEESKKGLYEIGLGIGF